MNTAVAVLALFVLLGCTKENDIDIQSGAGGNTGLHLPACGSAGSPAKGGPDMVRVGRLDGSCFWIDRTEVTTAQYQQFLDASAADVPACAAHNSSLSEGLPKGAAPGLPVTGVDWCDAAAFCAWAGKRLCGVYDFSGGSKSEYETVCTDGDHDGFSFAQVFSLAAANCLGNAAAPSNVASHPACVTPSGVYDLVGNVREWTSECDSVEWSSSCKLRGGSFQSTSASDWGCLQTASAPRDRVAPDLGFRCCSEDSAE